MIECEKCKAQTSLRVVLLKNQPSLVCTKLFTSSSTDRQGLCMQCFSPRNCEPKSLKNSPYSQHSDLHLWWWGSMALWQFSAGLKLAGIPPGVSKKTEPVLLCIKPGTGPKKRESGPQLWFLPMQCINSVITIDLCVSLVLRFTVECEAWLCRLTILWWTLAINFSSSPWYINTTLMFLPSFLSAELTLEHPPGHGKSWIKRRALTCTVG